MAPRGRMVRRRKRPDRYSFTNALERYIEGLEVTQGAGVGGRMQLFPWQRRFIRNAFRSSGDYALSIARANGKSTLVAAIGCAFLDDEVVRQPRAEVLVVASSFLQARVVFDHAMAFLGAKLADTRTWRVWDTQNSARIQHNPSGAVLQVISADPRRMHGRAPVLVLADEPAQWEKQKSEKALAALRTGMGKVKGSRLIALGTRPDDDAHWFERMLKGPRSVCYKARPGDPINHKRTWQRANPSLPYMPELEERLRLEAKEAKDDPVAAVAFEALRLNLGVSDTIEQMLLEAGVWRKAMGESEATGRYILGIDLGQTEAMSAVAGFWPETGRLDAIGCFGDDPSLKTRGIGDGVGPLWQKCADRGELITSSGRVSDVKDLLNEAWERWGAPLAIVCDRWREGELRDALKDLRWPVCDLVVRGMGYKDGSEDVRGFRRSLLTGNVIPTDSLLLAAAMSEARVVMDPAGNAKLAKRGEGRRRSTARDDAAAAAILAVGLGYRMRAGLTNIGGPKFRTMVV